MSKRTFWIECYQYGLNIEINENMTFKRNIINLLVLKINFKVLFEIVRVKILSFPIDIFNF